jgi:hypothetical protein
MSLLDQVRSTGSGAAGTPGGASQSQSPAPPSGRRLILRTAQSGNVLAGAVTRECVMKKGTTRNALTRTDA